jgi:type II secretory pathway pseudopilin PulG
MGEAMETRRLKPTFGEWCIVIGLVGLIAAAVRPDVSQAMGERRLTDLVARLHEVRSAIAVYKADRAGLYPGQQYFGGNVDPEAFVLALTAANPPGRKPYLSAMPQNPYCADAAAARRVVIVNNPAAKPAARQDAGWWFNAATGQFRALDSDFHAQY